MTSKQEYELYLQSEHWHDLRHTALLKYNCKCELCGSCKPHPHVHHIHYRNLTDVKIDDLMVLCEKCHSDVHKYLKKHPRRLGNREKLLSWRQRNLKRRKGTKTHKKWENRVSKKIKKIKRSQKRKKDSSFEETKLSNLRGVLNKTPFKPPIRRNKWRSFSTGEYIQPPETSGAQQLIASAIRTRIIPASSIKNQVGDSQSAQHCKKHDRTSLTETA